MPSNPILRGDGLEVRLAPRVGGAVADVIDTTGPEPRYLMRRSPEALADALDAACFPLVPFSNRVRDGRFTFRGRQVQLSPNMPGQKHPLHGQGWRGAWTVEAAAERSAELLFHHPAGEWPWAYEARQVFVLEDRALSITLSVLNRSDEPMPCGLGFHPYFPCDGGTILDTRVSDVWTVDDEVMPVARIPAQGRYALSERAICAAGLDNGYAGWSGETLIRWPAERRAAHILSPGAGFFQLFSPSDGGVVVAEPATHANAALNHPEDEWAGLGLRVLQPGEDMSLQARLAFSATD
jgi:aldose 1-epimerase